MTSDSNVSSNWNTERSNLRFLDRVLVSISIVLTGLFVCVVFSSHPDFRRSGDCGRSHTRQICRVGWFAIPWDQLPLYFIGLLVLANEWISSSVGGRPWHTHTSTINFNRFALETVTLCMLTTVSLWRSPHGGYIYRGEITTWIWIRKKLKTARWTYNNLYSR
jgi:hypothetical protein